MNTYGITTARMAMEEADAAYFRAESQRASGGTLDALAQAVADAEAAYYRACDLWDPPEPDEPAHAALAAGACTVAGCQLCGAHCAGKISAEVSCHIGDCPFGALTAAPGWDPPEYEPGEPDTLTFASFSTEAERAELAATLTYMDAA